MLKITMPIYTATFPQDFLKAIFLTGGLGPPLRIAYDSHNIWTFTKGPLLVKKNPPFKIPGYGPEICLMMHN